MALFDSLVEHMLEIDVLRSNNLEMLCINKCDNMITFKEGVIGFTICSKSNNGSHSYLLLRGIRS